MAGGFTRHVQGHDGSDELSSNAVSGVKPEDLMTFRVNTKAVRSEPLKAFDENDLGDLTGVQPFASSYERQQAFADPRYNRDEGYRREVNRRLAVG